jgi:hypothetical protein
MKLDEITNKKVITDSENPNDEFYTPNYAITPLIEYLKPNSRIWCPFDTPESNFVKLFEENGHKVICSHIKMGQDFFTERVPEGIEYIISNPPYSLKAEVFERLFSLNIPFAMLVGVVGLFESQRRFNLFKENEFEIMYFNKRVSYFRDYSEQKPSLNPPFSSVYICKGILPHQIVFEFIENKNN